MPQNPLRPEDGNHSGSGATISSTANASSRRARGLKSAPAIVYIRAKRRVARVAWGLKGRHPRPLDAGSFSCSARNMRYGGAHIFWALHRRLHAPRETRERRRNGRACGNHQPVGVGTRGLKLPPPAVCGADNRGRPARDKQRWIYDADHGQTPLRGTRLFPAEG